VRSILGRRRPLPNFAMHRRALDLARPLFRTLAPPSLPSKNLVAVDPRATRTMSSQFRINPLRLAAPSRSFRPLNQNTLTAFKQEPHKLLVIPGPIEVADEGELRTKLPVQSTKVHNQTPTTRSAVPKCAPVQLPHGPRLCRRLPGLSPKDTAGALLQGRPDLPSCGFRNARMGYGRFEPC
jgi:hypothetical protein